MKFDCPSCTQRLEAPEEVFGLTVTCPGCNSPIKVPDPRAIRVVQSTTPVQMPESKNVFQRLHVSLSDFGRELLAFGMTVVFATAFRWDAGDLIWGLWASSLLFGLVVFPTIYLTGITTGRGWSLRLMLAIQGLFVMTVSIVFYSFIHIVHGIVISVFFAEPSLNDRPMEGWWEWILPVFAAYWPIVLASALSRFPDLRKLGTIVKRLVKEDKAPCVALRGLCFYPYLGVIRMHLMIFVLAAVNQSGLNRFAVYPIMLFYFFPWAAVYTRLHAQPVTKEVG